MWRTTRYGVVLWGNPPHRVETVLPGVIHLLNQASEQSLAWQFEDNSNKAVPASPDQWEVLSKKHRDSEDGSLSLFLDSSSGLSTPEPYFFLRRPRWPSMRVMSLSSLPSSWRSAAICCRQAYQPASQGTTAKRPRQMTARAARPNINARRSRAANVTCRLLWLWLPRRRPADRQSWLRSACSPVWLWSHGQPAYSRPGHWQAWLPSPLPAIWPTALGASRSSP